MCDLFWILVALFYGLVFVPGVTEYISKPLRKSIRRPSAGKEPNSAEKEPKKVDFSNINTPLLRQSLPRIFTSADEKATRNNLLPELEIAEAGTDERLDAVVFCDFIAEAAIGPDYTTVSTHESMRKPIDVVVTAWLKRLSPEDKVTYTGFLAQLLDTRSDRDQREELRGLIIRSYFAKPVALTPVVTPPGCGHVGCASAIAQHALPQTK